MGVKVELTTASPPLHPTHQHLGPTFSVLGWQVYSGKDKLGHNSSVQHVNPKHIVQIHTKMH